MTERPLASVVKVAADPAQAKLLAARLQAEGIPAYIEGDSLADEMAMSQRLMNLTGVKVLVPTTSLERAKELLGPDDVAIGLDELTAQALAAAPAVGAEFAKRQAAAQGTGVGAVGGGGSRLWAIAATLLAVVFAGLWLETRAEAAQIDNPLLEYVRTPNGYVTHLRKSGARIAEAIDADADGHYEQFRYFGRGVEQELLDRDGDGLHEAMVERRQGLVFRWRDVDGDGLFDLCEVAGSDGATRQELRYVPERGFDVAPK